ncbi:hypothetical protein Pst134EA_013781 [Puccinia striiformis f. sp. tritici]|uniref:Secreted protein n=1 Tax=Puccinia striiformis f. sp. tritici PST-78 TaxID=1165861 RepID=A0A0L0VAW6_9BASI|nr:hypothetical protein Pst134EA_013781 [Puccinia striiformis f. sp. tritici]KAH9454687.1 hypothetical protein Pst134EB_014752 [Puccinia striiformis f. sp. tritici]KAH9465926.1 hypothetical protein Pst134EA_013781 [Puccinia striiformis f. sp. tritici]KAI9612844.1 hypothetical protein KEM48_003919 [Puccinia striiformis f. sp. tritici PST-130]KNE96427.1 hypothetical protein PSTG_10258 [Puccinia striiformis f. sp. tritici PST-78]
MLAQRNIFLVASAFVSSHLFLNVHGLALPLSSQTQGGYSSYSKRNANATAAAITPTGTPPGQTTPPKLAQRDIFVQHLSRNFNTLTLF